MADKLTKLLKERDSILLKIDRLRHQLEERISLLSKVKLTLKEETTRIDLADKLETVFKNDREIQRQTKKAEHGAPMEKLQDLARKEQKNKNELKKVMQKLKPLTAKSEKEEKFKNQTEKILKEYLEIKKKWKKTDEQIRALATDPGVQEILDILALEERKRGNNLTAKKNRI